MRKGYLLFTTHSGDELDATFIPESEKELIKLLKAVDNDKDMACAQDRVTEWIDANYKNSDFLRLHTQTRCFIKWPFSDVIILGTFYHLVC